MEAQSNVSLARYTTLKVGGVAGNFCQPSSVDELAQIASDLKQREEPFFILGGGSNLLVSNDGFEGTVVRTAKLIDMRQCESDIIEADAGARLPHLAKYAASLGLSGLEFLVGVPGTVGGAVIMNAGAHNSCVANILLDATVFDTATNDIQKMSNSELQFVYRHCALDPSRHVVLSARFKLNADDRATIEAKTKHNEEYRWKTQPLGWPNAGSTFKNPEPTRGAGLLLDQSGAKELKVGQAAVSSIHANFVINTGGATSQDVTTLMKRMQEGVLKKFDIRLHPEWKTLGNFSESEQEIWRG
jgi:UDP-N-acetylmuramate dehydrogenase